MRVALYRDLPEAYTGGQAVAVTVTVNASVWTGMTAMGLYEQVPPGWTFAGMGAVAGQAPGVAPAVGATGVLEFIWITPPRSPVAFEYRLQVPARDSGPRSFSGQVEYRLDAGKLTSNVALSLLDGIADELPVITLRGGATMTVPLNGDFADPGATASDKEDGDLTAQIETAGQVDTGEAGRYTLAYGVMDSAGNRALPVMRTVTVSASDTPGDGENAPASPSGPGNSAGQEELLRDLNARLDARAAARGKPGAARSMIMDPGMATGENRPEYRLPRASNEEGNEEASVAAFPEGVQKGAGTQPVARAATEGVLGAGPHGVSADGAVGAAPQPPGLATGPALAGLLFAAGGVVIAGGWMAYGRGARRGR